MPASEFLVAALNDQLGLGEGGVSPGVVDIEAGAHRGRDVARGEPGFGEAAHDIIALA